MSLGGAPSMDRSLRTAGVDWWPGEEVTDEDVHRVVQGGHADVMLAHDAPNNSTPAVMEVIRSPLPREWLSAMPAAMAGRRRMDRAFAAVLPDLYVHGHYHVHDDVTLPHGEIGDRTAVSNGPTRILALDRERTDYNVALLDVATLDIEPIDIDGIGSGIG